MDESIKQHVRSRAKGKCEYCQIPQEATPLASHHIEHIVARQHGGNSDLSNLALACDRCNAFKGPNLTTLHPVSGKLVALFHPREQLWNEHFRIEFGGIIGTSETGEATVSLLKMNARRRVQLRRLIS